MSDWRSTIETGKVCVVERSWLTRDPEIQEGRDIDPEFVAEYAMKHESGSDFPPGLCYFDGDKLYLVDAWHRDAAAELRGVTKLPMRIEAGDRAAALLHSTATNQHGRRNSPERTARNLRVALTSPLTAEWSNVQIARHCGVAEGTVRKFLKDNHDTAAIRASFTKQYTRKTTSGVVVETTMDTSNIGKAQKRDAALRKALHSFAESEERWAARRKTGLTDADLVKAISFEFGSNGGLDHSSWKGGKEPAFWFERENTKTPTLEGQALTDRVRKLLDIPQPGHPATNGNGRHHRKKPKKDERPAPPAPEPEPEPQKPTAPPEVPRDALGREIPDTLEGYLRESFRVRSKARKLARDLDRVCAEVLALSSTPGGEAFNPTQIDRDVETVKRGLNFYCPHAVCPACDGDGCAACIDRGWVTKSRFGGFDSELQAKAKSFKVAAGDAFEGDDAKGDAA